MTERLELYKCKICGNLVEVVLSGVGELVCCNEPMQHLNGKTNDDSSNDNLSVNTDNTAQTVEVNSALSQSYSYTVEDTSNMENSTMSYLV